MTAAFPMTAAATMPSVRLMRRFSAFRSVVPTAPKLFHAWRP